MTWDHPRGRDPLLACSTIWRERTGVEISWESRSLQDFESFPVADLARRYDLMVIDHPHVGDITAQHCLIPLDIAEREAECSALAANSVGPSWRSYEWRGHQWALPIDAATQVQAWRSDRIDAPAYNWDEALELARRGLACCPMRPPHSLMIMYTLSANLGSPCESEATDLFDRETGELAIEQMRELCDWIGPACFDMDPITALEAMAEADSRIAVAPLIYGYVSYARAGFRAARIRFADIPSAGSDGPIGSALGGGGIAVSAYSDHRAAAIDFAFWLASGPTQCGAYSAAGGQCGHAAAWEDESINAQVADFYRATRATLEGAWIRPRHEGYTSFQHAAAVRLNDGLRTGERAASLRDALNELYRASGPAIEGTGRKFSA
jgi:multiple sugar transport system substrate-binding protein